VRKLVALVTDRPTIIVVDDQPLLLDAFETVLTRHGFDVIGKATSASAARQMQSAQPADALLLDLQIPGENSLDFLRRARREHPRTLLIAVSDPGADEDIQAALDAGAVACVLKSAEPEDIATALRQVLDRSLYLRGSRGEAQTELPPGNRLTRRELDVLRLVAQGRSNADVGRELWVTEETVKFHLTKIYRKLGVSNRTEAARWAQLSGLLGDTTPSKSSRWRITG
jgi:DNA-binding NarL/FixJ family response regulator